MYIRKGKMAGYNVADVIPRFVVNEICNFLVDHVNFKYTIY